MKPKLKELRRIANESTFYYDDYIETFNPELIIKLLDVIENFREELQFIAEMPFSDLEIWACRSALETLEDFNKEFKL